MIPANRQIHAKLEIVRPSGRVDVTPYLEAAEVELGSIEDLGTGTGADIGVRTLTFSLRNDGQRVQYWDTDTLLGDSEKVLGDTEDGVDLTAIIGAGKWARRSFAPRDKQSDWNVVAGEWEPLLWPYRGVVFQVAVTAPGMAPNNWITLFEGYLGDNITTEPHRVTVRCRDKSKRLQDAYIDTPKTYTGPMAAETLIQAIINDYVENPPQLYCPVASGITFDEMKVEYVSVWDAIQNVAKQMGWFLGYRWNGSGFVLTFMEPPRSKNTADFLFNWEDDIYHETLDISDADIRNVVTVVYRDTATGERETVTVSNPGSIEEYTKRAMQIEEADTSLIDNYSKAYDFAQKCLWDLSELSATDKLDMPVLPELDLFSTFAVTNPLISSTTDFFAVQSVRHSLDFGDQGRFRTEVIATGRVVGARKRWTDMETRPGRPGQPLDPGRIPPGELPPDRLPDYSLGVDKFMEGLKPPIMVTSKPDFPDPRYPVGTILYYTVERILYEVTEDGMDWKPLNAGTLTADELIAGIARIGGLTVDHLQGRKLLVGETDPETAGMSAVGPYRFWAGGEDPSEAPFNVDESGRIEATEADIAGTIQSTDPETGDYSLLDAGRLSFHKVDGEDEVQSYYVSKMESGVAENGQRVTVNFDSPPKVLVSPNILELPGSTTDIQIETFATDISKDGFTVWSRVVEPGPIQSSYPNVLLEEGQSWTSGTTQQTTQINLVLELRCVIYIYNRSAGKFRFRGHAEYRSVGGDWTKLRDFDTEFSFSRGRSIWGTYWQQQEQTSTVELGIELPQDAYQVRVTFQSAVKSGGWFYYPGTSSYLHYASTRVHELRTSTFEQKTAGTANWIAIEGGA